MAVPITFLDKHNPDQFEILGITNSARYIGFPEYEVLALIDGKKISENSFQYKDITRYFFEKSEIKHLLEQNFKIISFEEDEHQNPDNTISAWWKILVKN